MIEIAAIVATALAFAAGRWTGRRGLQADVRRAYIMGVSDGVDGVARLLNERPDAPAVPPSAEVQAEVRRRA
jgi:hypothetical protein